MENKKGVEMKKIKCYLAGWFVSLDKYPDWRDFVQEQLKDVMDFYDPRRDTKQGSIATFVYEDLVDGVEGSDVVFYFVTNAGDVGSAIECERAECKDKLVILCIANNVKVVHPFLIGIARRIFIGMETGIAYLRNLAKYGLENEFQAIQEVLKK